MLQIVVLGWVAYSFFGKSKSIARITKEYVKKVMNLHGSISQKLDDAKSRLTKIEEMFDYATNKKIL